MNHDLDFVPRIDRARLEAERRTDPLRYGLEPHEGMHQLWARVQAEPADPAPRYRFAWLRPGLALSGAATTAVAVALVVGLSNQIALSPMGEPDSAGGDAGVMMNDDRVGEAPGSGVDANPSNGQGGQEYAPEYPPAQPLGDPHAACMPMDEARGLAERDFAFDGTVTAIAGEQVSFDVHVAFVGSDVDMTVSAPGLTADTRALTGSPGFEVGRRYLVAGDEATAWSCGFTLTYDPATAREWEIAISSAWTHNAHSE